MSVTNTFKTAEHAMAYLLQEENEAELKSWELTYDNEPLLAKQFRLCKAEAYKLRRYLANVFETGVNFLPDLKDMPNEVWREFIVESLHDNLDGWEEDQKVVILAFLHDMKRFWMNR